MFIFLAIDLVQFTLLRNFIFEIVMLSLLLSNKC